LVTPGDINEFVGAVSTLCREPARWAAMSATAHSTAKRRFSVATMGAAYLELVTDLHRGRYPRPRSRRFAPVDLSLFSWRECLPGRVRRMKRGVSSMVRSRLAAAHHSTSPVTHAGS
jgi:hypothetical protein